MTKTHCFVLLDKREEFWNDSKSGMSYFSTLRSSIKRQMKNQKLQDTATLLKTTSNRLKTIKIKATMAGLHYKMVVFQPQRQIRIWSPHK